MENLHLIVGLGNPGAKYARTRHNVGFQLVEHLADRWRTSWTTEKKLHASVARAERNGFPVLLSRPQTFMNNSGEAVRHYAKRPFFAIANDLLLVTDEVAFPVGRYRFRAKGSAGGHNGLKSIEAHLHTQEYARLRIGVGPAEEDRKVGVLKDYVLGDFGKSEGSAVRALLPELQAGVECWLSLGILETMNRFPGKGVNGVP